MSVEEVAALWSNILRKIRSNKVHQAGTVGRYRVAAIDMSGSGNSNKISCDLCHNNVHKVVFSYTIGQKPHIFLGLEPVQPGEGETIAAERLLEWIHAETGNWIDVFALDGLYKAPFINKAVDLGYHVVIRTEEERLNIIEDAKNLYSQMPPKKVGVDPERLYEYKIWDEEGFSSWSEVNIPLRVLQIEQRHIREETTSLYWIITTLPSQRADTLLVKEMAHCRWNIENNAFHNLKTYYDFEHVLCHEENAVVVALWFKIIAFSLLMLFLHRYLFHLAKQLEDRKIMVVHLIHILDRSLALPITHPPPY